MVLSGSCHECPWFLLGFAAELPATPSAVPNFTPLCATQEKKKKKAKSSKKKKSSYCSLNIGSCLLLNCSFFIKRWELCLKEQLCNNLSTNRALVVKLQPVLENPFGNWNWCGENGFFWSFQPCNLAGVSHLWPLKAQLLPQKTGW